nr:MAG TPA: hypothetical protein [Bacteriophage sp.]DAU66594.1 MAG TPA: hypothetical protein [Caudoviricetes sp.]
MTVHYSNSNHTTSILNNNTNYFLMCAYFCITYTFKMNIMYN